MGKFFGSGYNITGRLGLGDNTSKTFFTENDLGDLSILKCGGYYTSSGTSRYSTLNIALLSDGFLYISGGLQGTTASYYNTLVRAFDSVKLTDMVVMPNSTASSTTVYGIDENNIYMIYIHWDTDRYYSTYETIDDSKFQWSGVKNKRLIANANGTGNYGQFMIATDDTVYIVKGDFSVASTISMKAKKIEIQKSQISTTGYFSYYILDTDGYLWGMGRNQYDEIKPGAGSLSTFIKIFDTTIKSFSTIQRMICAVDTNGGFHLWGQNANLYHIRDDVTETDLSDTSAFIDNVKNAWLIEGAYTSSAGKVAIFSIFIQKSDGTIWANGANNDGMLGIGSKTNATTLVQTSNTVYGNVNMSNVSYSTFIYEGEIAIDLYVYDPTASYLLATFNKINGVKKINLGGVLPAFIEITDKSNNVYSANLQYSSEREFLGLSYNPNSNSANFLAGSISDTNITSNTNLFIALGEAVITQGFEIRTFKNNVENNRVQKNATNPDGSYLYLTPINIFTGHLREECSLMNPIITFEMPTVPQFNYVYIPPFHRYYYVNDITSVNKNIWNMSLSCDVLCSFQDVIYNTSNAIINRTQATAYQNGSLEDPYMRVENEVDHVIINSDLPSVFGNSEYRYILETIGRDDIPEGDE